MATTHLRLIVGGKSHSEPVEKLQGPITRMGLWEQFKPLSKKHILVLFLPKLLLLASLIYLLSRH